MKTSLKRAFFLIVFGLMLISVQPAKAQCAQCAATVETNMKSGDTTARGLNKGIIFLLAAPYLAAAAVGLIWYKKYRRKNVNIDMHDEKLNLN
ncbi:MAG TPA: hypothetical protein VIM16_16100 [Mucilaginibacter sp.]